jgi:hypothetical protein
MGHSDYRTADPNGLADKQQEASLPTLGAGPDLARQYPTDPIGPQDFFFALFDFFRPTQLNFNA